MTEDKKQLDQIAKDLADGKVIDWKRSKLTNTGKRRLIEQLKAIANISKAYDVATQDGEHPIATAVTGVLFEWGHLQVLEKIGEGSYGEVYRAYDSVLDREVALKLLKQEKMAPIQSRAFIQEARRLAKVRNRHVLAIHGANVHESNVGMWSDLIDGINLADKRISDDQDQQKYTSNQLIQVMVALADALIAVHDAGLIHGDIKPSNVMVDNRNKFTLMDFGAGTESDEESSHSGYLMGTLLYMAPELFEKNELSSTSDIYALGVLLFNLATGSYPVKGKSLAAIKLAHDEHNYASFNQFQNIIPKNVQHLIQQMLLTDPKARPTAAEIKNKLNWIIAAPQRRNKRLAIGLIVGLSVLGTLISSVGFYRASQAQQIAVQEKEKAEAVSEFMKDTLKAPASLGKGNEVRVADLLATASGEAAEKFIDQPHAKSAILQAIGDSYSSLQLPQDALKHLTTSIQIKQKLYGVNSPEVLSTLAEIALQNYRLGHLKKSKSQLLKVIDIASIYQVTEMVNLAQIRLAAIIGDEGGYQQAESLLKQLLEQIPDENSPSNDHRLLALLALANSYIDQSQYLQAETTAKQGLAWLHKHHPNKADINKNALKNAIATALSQQGKFDEAEIYFRELVVDTESLFGRQNTGYLRSIFNLSAVLQDQGKLHEALELLEQALILSRELDQGESLSVLRVGNNLANLKSALNDLAGAESLMRETLAKAVNFLADDHGMVLMLELNLSEILNLLGRYQAAEKLALATSMKMQQALGDSHMFSILIFDQLAISFAGQKRFDDAELMQDQVLKRLQESGHGKSPEMTQVMNHLIDTLLLSGQLTKAESKLENLILLQEEIFGEGHPDVLKSKQILKDLRVEVN